MSRQNCFFPGCDNMTEDDSTLCKYHLSGGTNTSNTVKTDDGVVSDELRAILDDEIWKYTEIPHKLEVFITQYGNSCRIGELQRIDVANTGNGISFWFEDYPENNGWATMREYTAWRLAELRKEDV